MSDRIRRGSYKLTFAAWSSLLLLWAVTTAVMDEDTLRLVRRYAGERGDGAILLIGLVIALPLIVDASRNVHRIYRLWRRRGLHDGEGASWSGDSIPAMTPRRFTSTTTLTRRERTIVEHGQLAYGRVQHHGPLTSLVYTTPWGARVTTRPVELDDRPVADASSPILFEPGAKMGVAPVLMGLSFLTREAPDERPPRSAERLLPLPDDTFSVPARASLHPIERASGHHDTEVGSLAFDGATLTLSCGDTEPVSLRLDRPFAVALSCFLLPGGEAEVNVALEPLALGAYRADRARPLRFKTELGQRQVAADLPRDWSDAIMLTPRDFALVWRKVAPEATDERVATALQL